MVAKVIIFFLILLFPFTAFGAVTYNGGTDTITVDAFTEGTPCTFADILAADGVGGWGQITNPIPGVYVLVAHLDVGDGTVAWLSSQREHIFFDGYYILDIKANATFEVGVEYVADEVGYYGSTIAWTHSDATDYSTNMDWDGVFIGYNFVITDLGSNAGYKNVYIVVSNADSKFIQGTVHNLDTFWIDGASTFYEVYITNCWSVRILAAVTASNVQSRGNRENFYVNEINFVDVTVSNVNLEDATSHEIVANWNWKWLILKDSKFSDVSGGAGGDGGIKKAFSFNVHVVDKDGNDIEDVVVDCVDKDDAAVWIAGTVTTDASGDITEQTIGTDEWTNDSGSVHLTYYPHEFTISKAGYRTVEIKGVTLNQATSWEIELDDGDTVIYDSTIYDSTIY